MDQTKRMHEWWNSLGQEDRELMLALEEGSVIPTVAIDGLFRSGVPVPGSKWETEPGFTFFVSKELADFLHRQRSS
ncbi:hypothetical protein [Streptomyces sp. NPDC096153]|uniref:hypothetical protein n=1 Tax=Streptomyces sp. NPDC096153 TaxID=3155548 RepID=UPI00332AE6FF